MREADIERLVVSARNGDRDALEQLLVHYWTHLCAHIARRVPPTSDAIITAEDVAQEALLEAFQKIDRLREATPRVFLAWLKALGEMSLARSLRQQGTKKRGGQVKRVDGHPSPLSSSTFALTDFLPDDAKAASSVLARNEAVAALQVAVASLPDDQRRALQLSVFEGRTVDETAAVMNRTVAAVRGLVHRGKQRIAESLGRASRWFSTR